MRGRERRRSDFAMTSDGERAGENGNMVSGNVRTCTVVEREENDGGGK